MAEENRAIIDEKILADILYDDNNNERDNEDDNDDDDDQVKDPVVDLEFDKELIRDSEQSTAKVLEPDASDLFGDEEPEGSDNGIEGSDLSDIETKSVESLQIISEPIQTVGSGRGRFGKKALDENNQELPTGRILVIKEEVKSLRMATLPASYHRKREDPEIQKQRRALRLSNPLIDFRATFNHIAFIIDKDDGEEKGYEHACRRFNEIQPDLKLDPAKRYYDIWNFGLYIYPIAFEKPISCSLLELIPQEINANNRPFWFMFKRPPKLENMKFIPKSPPANRKFIPKIPPRPDRPKGITIKIDRTIRADLSSGALISMNRFCVREDDINIKRDQWSLRFHDEFFEIQTIVPYRFNNDNNIYLREIKYKIPLDIIDRAVVFHLWNNGFSVFINMKGNVHVLHRERQRRTDKDVEEKEFVPFKRQGVDKNGVKPSFSTARIRIAVKSDDQLIDLFDRQGKTSQGISQNDINDLVQTTREDSLNQIRGIFKHLLDFFYKNRIHVCFGPIRQRMASIEQLNTLKNYEFHPFIRSYSWSMLCSIGFRIQMQLILAKQFIGKLHEYSNSQYKDETPEDIDNRFYWLCLYLHRRSSEYFFLDLDQEIDIGIKEYQTKRKLLKRKKPEQENSEELPQLPPSSAYIPSVVLTPTTINIRPLKLSKLNRVLREERFGGVLNFALVELRDEAQRLLFPSEFRSLKDQILNYLTNGFEIGSRRYIYLHHSQSQVKCKQFWFYYHDEENRCLSHADAYRWMGDFSKERVVAKHAARIALCFTSTDATIRIPANKVAYLPDIKDATRKYTFTDGVGTISTELRDDIQEYLRRFHSFSVIQIRYGGCKGTLSVDPRLDGQEKEVHIRDSMLKFDSGHDILEVCKLSAPRALYLNRQDIVLLESRDIPHTNFLLLQNEDHFRLIRALLSPSVAYELLSEKILPIFRLDRIAQKLNIVEEQFFMKLIITCAFNVIRELIDRTRIRISDMKARNMFGVVDEYGVLESGQVFVQYSIMKERKLERFEGKEEEDDGYDDDDDREKCEILEGEVVVTKNPCHHPGDLRVFEAVDRVELRHLKDVIVFPQKGRRPHPNEISGSDLDGDEYVVIWHQDLIPKTRNEDPYDYDSQEEPQKLDRPVTREDINKVVMEVSEQDCLGVLSNIHLAYADKFGIKSEVCKELAGYISQEVDAAKTGKHPLSNERIIEYREGLGGKWPDFMKGRGKNEFYPSERVLGKLYRSARRAVTGWSRAISNHGNPRHIHLALALTNGTDIKDQEPEEILPRANILLYYKQPLDPYIYHDDSDKYLPEIKILYHTYRNELLEIINLYHFQDEIDLFCRSESMDTSAGGSKKGDLADSAAIEVKNLTKRIIDNFFREFNIRGRNSRCCKYIDKTINGRLRRKRIDCERCKEDKLAKAACAYKHSYQESNRLPLKSNRRILSFPWLFPEQLLQLKYRNNPQNIGNQRDTIVGRAFSSYLQNFIPKFKVLIPINSRDNQGVEFYYEKNEEKRASLLSFDKRADEKLPSVSLLRACFIEVLNDWLTKENVFGSPCDEIDRKPLVPESIWHELMIQFLSGKYQPNIRLLSASIYQTAMAERYRQTIDDYRYQWTNKEYEELQKMFDEIHAIAVEHVKATQQTIWTYLDEYIILALQCISIEKRLIENWICP